MAHNTLRFLFASVLLCVCACSHKTNQPIASPKRDAVAGDYLRLNPRPYREYLHLAPNGSFQQKAVLLQSGKEFETTGAWRRVERGTVELSGFLIPTNGEFTHTVRKFAEYHQVGFDGLVWEDGTNMDDYAR